MKKWNWLLIVLLAFFLAGCNGNGSRQDGGNVLGWQNVLGGNENTTPYYADLLERVTVGEMERFEKDGSMLVKVEVVMPPYGQMMEALWERAGTSADSAAEFEMELYKLVLQGAKNEGTVRKTVSLDISALNPDGDEWTEEALRVLAKKTAFEEELEAFCMKMIMEDAPRLEVDAG